MRRTLPEIATERPVTVTMLVITLIGLGVIASARMPLEFMPKVDLPYMAAWIVYPGASPKQVEQEIAIPAEGEFRTLPNLNRLSTHSTSSGCSVSLEFEMGADMNESLAEVRDRIERLRLVLPDSVDTIYIRHFSTDAMPVMSIGLAGEGDRTAFGDLILNGLAPKLQRIEGVADVAVNGIEEESVLIEFDQNALLRHNTSIFQVMGGLRNASINVSAGELLDGRTRYYVRSLDEFRRPQELADLPIGQGLRLKDVAQVGYRERDNEMHMSVDGRNQLLLQISKEAEANTVATCAGVIAEIERVLALPEFQSTEHLVLFDQGDIIRSARDGLLKAGLLGGVFSVIILLAFLGRFRPTIVVALAIPGSVVTGIIVMYFIGISLNLVTMMSLIVGIGMVVDNSIVVVENIYRYRGMGYSPMESARRGASEVSMAIVAATLTTCIVFIPAIFLEPGPMTTFMTQFAVAISSALGASLIIALTVIPVATSRFHDKVPRTPSPDDSEDATAKPNSFARRFRRHSRKAIAAYSAILRLSMNWRLATLLLIISFGWITYTFPLKNLGLQDMPEIDNRRVTIRLDLEANSDFEDTASVFNVLSSAIDKSRDELGVRNIVKNHWGRKGSIELILKRPGDYPPGEKPPYTSDDVMKILSQRHGFRIPGGQLRYYTEQSATTGGSGGQKSVSMRIQGDDIDTLEQYADRLVEVMNGIEEITDADKNTRPPDQEIQLAIDESLAERSGINSTAIAQTVAFGLQGTRLPDMKRAGREVPVWAQFREEDRKSKANLDNVMLLGTEGVLVPLGQLVDYTKANTPQSISRMNGKNYIWVSAKTTGSDLSKVQNALRTLKEDFDLPPGYSLAFGDELQNLDQDLGSFLSTLGMAVILIYIVMAALFESFLLPLSILVTVPLASIGVVWIMYLTGTAMDSIAFIGCILMVGVVVNNGIVIIDHINNLRKKGMARIDAVVQAGTDRLRPVIMTALTTILGAVPLAVGIGTGAEAVTGLGRALIGGLTAGTVLTLFVVPLFYTFIDDAQQWCLRYYASLAHLRSESREEGPPPLAATPK